MNTTMPKFDPRTIRSLRRLRGATLRETAKVLGWAPTKLSHVENGKVTLSARDEIAVARAFWPPEE